MTKNNDEGSRLWVETDLGQRRGSKFAKAVVAWDVRFDNRGWLVGENRISPPFLFIFIFFFFVLPIQPREGTTNFQGYEQISPSTAYIWSDTRVWMADTTKRYRIENRWQVNLMNEVLLYGKRDVGETIETRKSYRQFRVSSFDLRSRGNFHEFDRFLFFFFFFKLCVYPFFIRKRIILTLFFGERGTLQQI